MTKRVCEGEASEEYVKKRIHSANRILESCDIAEKIGTVITFIGIPALAIPTLGSILTFAGGGIVTSEFAIKRKFNWALISNR